MKNKNIFKIFTIAGLFISMSDLQAADRIYLIKIYGWTGISAYAPKPLDPTHDYRDIVSGAMQIDVDVSPSKLSLARTFGLRFLGSVDQAIMAKCLQLISQLPRLENAATPNSAGSNGYTPSVILFATSSMPTLHRFGFVGDISSVSYCHGGLTQVQ